METNSELRTIERNRIQSKAINIYYRPAPGCLYLESITVWEGIKKQAYEPDL